MTDLQSKKPFLLITIDTEGDDLWSHPKNITTKNVNYLPRFQTLCEYYGFKPTYLANYEMACSPAFKEFGLNLISNNAGEIGMHLHAWNNPPLFQLTKDDYHYQPYLIEYPSNIIYDKIKIITDLLEEMFNQKMTSHRSGRWAFNDIYAKYLIDNGYKVDCSVTPLRSWKKTLGNPEGEGGVDYLEYPNKSYWINDFEDDNEHSLLEIPLTIISQNNFINYLINNSRLPTKWIIRSLRKHIKPVWLRPNGDNLDKMKAIIDYKHNIKSDYVMFVLHSSELMPDGSPTFKTERDIENLYYDLNELFSYSKNYFNGGTLSDYYSYYVNKRT